MNMPYGQQQQGMQQQGYPQNYPPGMMHAPQQQQVHCACRCAHAVWAFPSPSVFQGCLQGCCLFCGHDFWFSMFLGM
jgi:hypothetical protein